MNLEKDSRIVMTLDAGGTNFVFSAIQANVEIIDPIRLPSNGHDLQLCLQTIVDGFSEVKTKLPSDPAAISFAFPAPADYPNGIIGELLNFPSFMGTDGIAIGPMLEEKFKIPVFINNDGDLYAYGEALSGFLPHINKLLEEAGSPRRFKNLLGVTLGTGFGGGIVTNNRLFGGDNSMAAEVWLLRNKMDPSTNVEESVSIRAVQRVYAQNSATQFEHAPSPKEIYEIGTGTMPGNQEAAIEAFRQLGEALGDALGNILTIVDGLAVIGGGLAGAKKLIVPAMMKELNSTFTNYQNQTYDRIVQKVFYLDDQKELDVFLKGNSKTITVPMTDKKITYDPMARLGVGFSKIGASKAISLGAYAYALNNLDIK